MDNLLENKHKKKQKQKQKKSSVISCLHERNYDKIFMK